METALNWVPGIGFTQPLARPDFKPTHYQANPFVDGPRAPG